jgi:hypothetical protein
MESADAAASLTFIPPPRQRKRVALVMTTNARF